MPSRTREVQKYGQSIWQDYIERAELFNGKLARMVDEDGIYGVTSNPTIFHQAITKSADYDDQLRTLAGTGKNKQEIYHAVTVADIKEGCKILRKVHDLTKGADGFVSLEVNPELAYDTQGTVKEAKLIFNEIKEPNLMVKVPGTTEGIPAVRSLIAAGINVNVTLLFSPAFYEKAAIAYIEGLEDRAAQGLDLSNINSVASFFLSRIDTQADKELDALLASGKISKEEHKALRGEAAIAVAKKTYAKFKELFYSPRFDALKAKGAKVQRPLWASTGTKDPAYSDVKYVEALIGPHTVNTLPPATIDAFRDHGNARPALEEDGKVASDTIKRITAAGVNIEKIFDDLQSGGVKSFIKSYTDLLAAIEEKRNKFKA